MRIHQFQWTMFGKVEAMQLEVRVKRPLTIDVMDIDEYIQRNADPIWLHQNEMWEYMRTEDEGLF